MDTKQKFSNLCSKVVDLQDKEIKDSLTKIDCFIVIAILLGMIDLKSLNKTEREGLIIKLLQEQVVDQRTKLHFWRELTKQAAQIDTGYIAQHLVSLITSKYGSTMRGKGDDIEDGSEVKSANFLDSLDKRGAVAPRWNCSSNSEEELLYYLQVPFLYLVSLDLNKDENFRVRVWEVNPRTHENFNSRYKEWMEKLALPKLADPKRPGVNFQLFPPRLKTDEDYARHGNGRSNGFNPIQIRLQGVTGARNLLHAEESDGVLIIKNLTLD